MVAVLVCMALPARAQYFGGDELEIVFVKGKIPAKTAWSDSLRLTDAGLHFSSPGRSASADLWVQTDRVPVGLAWRPPTAAGFTLSVKGEMGEGALASAYLRYGCDGRHWSTWYRMIPQEKPAEGFARTYKHDLVLPLASSARYGELMREWWKTKPDWGSDEHALCLWIARRYPSFFAEEFPFIGYVQFRLEMPGRSEEMTIASLAVKTGWSVSGLTAIPQSGVTPDRGTKWHFER
jgi:hypothetical protein